MEKHLYTKLLITALYLVITIFITCVPIILLAAENSKESFNLGEIEILEGYQFRQPGEEIWFTTKILKIGEKAATNITVAYEIIDSHTQIIATDQETINIESQASFVGKLKIPENTPKGDYNLMVKILVNNNEEAQGKNSFKIGKERDKYIYYIASSIAVLAVLLIFIYLISKSKKFIEKLNIKRKIKKIVRQRSENISGNITARAHESI